MRNSTAYFGTFDLGNDDDDVKAIDIIKKTIIKSNKQMVQKRRVLLRGRKPLTKFKVVNYYTEKESFHSYDYHGNIPGGLKNATKVDVYIYNR